MTIGDRLKQLRLEHQYTLKYVGKKIGTTKQTVFKYEAGITANIPYTRIILLARLYDVTPVYIMGWEEGELL